MDVTSWILIGIFASVVLAVVIYYAVKFFKMSPTERIELIVNWLIGWVNIAERLYNEEGKGKEKMAWVEEQWKKRAPLSLKIILWATKSASLPELIEKALEIAKHTQWDK